MKTDSAIIPAGRIEQSIPQIWGPRGKIDADVAMPDGVPPKVLNQALTRNKKRFPNDFMFQLHPQEKQEAVTNCDYPPAPRFSPSFRASRDTKPWLEPSRSRNYSLKSDICRTLKDENRVFGGAVVDVECAEYLLKAGSGAYPLCSWTKERGLRCCAMG